jgi:lysophospholipase L1-like esterase
VTASAPSGLRFVALGDSYTIGTDVDTAGSWPAQLVERLAATTGAASLRLIANLAVNGYTSDDVIRFALPELERLRPEFVSLLIGVNDVVRGVARPVYAANLETILAALLRQCPAGNVLTVSIPDYTVTPRGADFGDRRQRREEIQAYNALMERRSSKHGIGYVDINDLSLRVADDRSLVAADGLHPSAVQYRQWVDRIAPVVDRLLAASGREVSARRA